MMQGNFIWHELTTGDPAAAAKFYTEVTGWQAKDSGVPGVDYTVFQVPGFDMGVAGMAKLTPETCNGNMSPSWSGYVAVDDVDAKAREFAEDGGKVLAGPADIPGIGRFAVVADLHCAAISLFKPVMPEGPMPPMPEASTPGTFGWNELYAGDGKEAFAFYSKRFGWQPDMAVDMGAMGSYQTFKLDGPLIGGMMTKMEHMAVPFWSYYINVAAIDAAVDRVKAAGGQVVNGPHEVPRGSWIINCLDPQGAMFSLVAPKR